MEDAIGVDFTSSCFLPKLGFTSQFALFFCVFHKIIVWFRSTFATRQVATCLSKNPKRATVACSFVALGEKGTWFQSPEAKLRAFRSPGSSKNAFYLHFYNAFCLREEKAYILHGFGPFSQQDAAQLLPRLFEPVAERSAFRNEGFHI